MGHPTPKIIGSKAAEVSDYGVAAQRPNSGVPLPDSIEKCHQIMKGLRNLVLLKEEQLEKKKPNQELLDLVRSLEEQKQLSFTQIGQL